MLSIDREVTATNCIEVKGQPGDYDFDFAELDFPNWQALFVRCKAGDLLRVSVVVHKEQRKDG